jgi:hypothetical protein
MVSAKHLFLCWDYFKRGKNKKEEIVYFERHLEDHIFELEEELLAFIPKRIQNTTIRRRQSLAVQRSQTGPY